VKDHWVKIHQKSFVLQVFVVVVPSMIPLGQSPTLIRRHQLFKGPFGGFPEMSADPVAECFKTGRSSSPSVNEREWERPFWKWSLVKTPLLEWSLPSQGNEPPIQSTTCLWPKNTVLEHSTTLPNHVEVHRFF